MRLLLLIFLMVATTAAFFACKKSDKENYFVVCPEPGTPLIWKGEAQYPGSTFYKPDSILVIVLNADKSYWVQGERSVGQHGTYSLEWQKTKNGASSDTIITFNPGPVLSKDVTLRDKLYFHMSNDTIFLRSIDDSESYSVDYFSRRP